MLNFTDFVHLQNWSVQYLLGNVVRYNKRFPTVPIGTLIKRNMTQVDIEDNVEYIRPTVKTMGGGVVRRDVARGVDIGTKNQYRIRQGQFLMSKIDARNGAFGIVPEECDGAIITSNFWAYDINVSIVIPQYMALVASTRLFADFAEKASNGTTNRHYLQEDLLLRKQIPLPTMAEQQALVDKYNALMEAAKRKEEQAAQTEQEIQTYLSAELGIATDHREKHKGLFFVNFSDIIGRWDMWQHEQGESAGCFTSVPLRECICHFMTDEKGISLRTETKASPTKDFKYIGMEHVEKNTGALLEMPTIKGSAIKSQTVRVPYGYFIYGKLRPYLNKYWYNDSAVDNIVCSSEMYLFKIVQGINTRYFESVIGSDIVQRQLTQTTGARMPRVNEGTFLSVTIPLPPLDKQTEIADHITALRAEIKQLRTEAVRHRQQALSDFERAVFEE